MIDANYRFVIALYCEALPIINFYNLKLIKDKEGIFKCYKNIKNTIGLIISGVGNINSAAATIYLYSIMFNSAKSIWINIGTGAHWKLKQGEIYHIKKVVSASYPKDVLYSNANINIIDSYEIFNVDKEEKEFKLKDKIYEMEAYGFLKTLEKFCYRELTCVIKIISDNSKSKPVNFSKYATDIVGSQTKIIDQILKEYIKLANQVDILDNILIDNVQDKFAISFSNKAKLSKLLNKVEFIEGENRLKKKIAQATNLKKLIRDLEKIIEQYTLEINNE